MSYLFYVQSSDLGFPLVSDSLDSHYRCELWRPTLGKLVPYGFPKVPFIFWWSFHYLHVFSNHDYAVFIAYDSDRVIHRSCVFPRYFRFPFMAQNDLQIGDTWTHPDHHGKGLAVFAIRKIVETLRMPDRTFWYVVEQDNLASIRVVEKAGFKLVGKGNRIKRFGVKALGAYIIQQPILPHQ